MELESKTDADPSETTDAEPTQAVELESKTNADHSTTTETTDGDPSETTDAEPTETMELESKTDTDPSVTTTETTDAESTEAVELESKTDLDPSETTTETTTDVQPTQAVELESKADADPSKATETTDAEPTERDTADAGFEDDDTLDSPTPIDPHKPHVVMPLPPSAMKKPPLKSSLKTEIAEIPPHRRTPKTSRDWEHELAKSKLETEVYRGALVSQIETTKQALSDAHRMSHVLLTTKGALEESMATMVVEIQTQTEQIKSLKEMVALTEEELQLCYKMLDDRDTRLADTEIALDALERVHSDLMDAREMKISELEKDLEIYKKVFGEMLDEKDLELCELEEELRALREMHGELLAVRQKEKQQNTLLESVFSKKVDTVIDYEAFEKAEQALEDEYGPVGIEQETRLDLLLTALSSTENEISDLKTKIKASSRVFDSTITMPTAADTGTTADSSILSDDSDAAMIQRLQQRIKELEQKNKVQEDTIESLQLQVKGVDALKLQQSGAEVLL